jgi:transcriptional regulator with XRE-family HTH domain
MNGATGPGARLRAARNAKGLPQWEVARKARISQYRLSRLENGAERVREIDALMLGRLLGLDPSSLTGPHPSRERPAALWTAVTVSSFRAIPSTCPCDWERTVADTRPAPWRLVLAKPGCAHHRAAAARVSERQAEASR